MREADGKNRRQQQLEESSDQQSSLSHLRGYKGISMTKTTLKPFKDVEEVVKQFNKSLEKLEVYSETESRKMIQVANNKVSDDASYNK